MSGMTGPFAIVLEAGARGERIADGLAEFAGAVIATPFAAER